jgi:hypothetical protein
MREGLCSAYGLTRELRIRQKESRQQEARICVRRRAGRGGRTLDRLDGISDSPPPQGCDPDEGVVGAGVPPVHVDRTWIRTALAGQPHTRAAACVPVV